MSTATSTAPDDVELIPGYRVAEDGAWVTLPWPDRLEDLPPSLFPGLARWARGEAVWGLPALGVPRLLHPLTGEPWRWTPGQARFLHQWWALRPDGRWLYRSGVKRGAKGTGKDPMLASVAWCCTAGPVVFAGWDEQHQPVGRPHRLALVQIAANSEAQGADVLRVANAMPSEAFRHEVGIDAGILRTQLGGGSRIELLTASQKSAEGDPATDILLNESHHMTQSSGGQAIAAVARRNVGKSPGGQARLLEATNAHMPGEGSVAEDSYDAWQAQVSGQTRRRDILYDSREAAPHLRLHVEEELELIIAQAYEDAPWVDPERIRDEAQDPRVPAADSIRYYGNALPTSETAWAEPRRWDARARPDIVVTPGEPMAVFLDCSKSSDATVLAGCRISDGHVLALGGWQRPHGDRGKGWLAPREEVDAAVRLAMDTWAVQWLGVDPSPARDDEDEAQYWGEMIDGLHRDFAKRLLLWATPGPKGSSVAFDMRLSIPGGKERVRLFTAEAELTAAAIDDEADEELTHDGDSMMRVHVHNARMRPNQWGTSLGKSSRGSKKLVDYAVAMVGARLGRRLVLNSGKALRRGDRSPAKVVIYR